ncbi:MAG: HAD-IC family P-type ATPase, partial [Candidatus Paceibacterota bacterium]
MPNTPTKTKMRVEWHTLRAEAVAEKLSIDTKRGLSADAVEGSRELHGSNQLTEQKSFGLFTLFISQFRNPLILILLVAGIATLLLGEYTDTIVIFIALLVNVVIGTFQEERASRAFSALNKKQITQATVIRDGTKQVVLADEVVVGDIVELDAGMQVPADVRLIQEKNLKVNEAALTGEWLGVSKQIGKLSADTPVTDRLNMVYKGTLVETGESHGIVVAVGDDTELGRIAQELTAETGKDTPIQQHMQRLARFVAVISLVAVALIFILGVARAEPLVEMVLVAIAVAVSVVPEGLPAAVTVVLAIGMEKILSRGGLVKNLRAAETLGSTTTIMTDKTGTLTEAKMVVADLLSFDQIMGEPKSKGEAILSPLQLHLLEAAVTSSDAFVEHVGGERVVRGRPIERALVQRGLEADFNKEELDTHRLDFLAFSSENRFAVSLSQAKAGDEDTKNQLFVSGAPETVLAHSSFIYSDESALSLDDSTREHIEELQREKSSEGKRLIAVAYKPNSGEKIKRSKEGEPAESQVSDLVFLGLVSFSDPIRSDVPNSIAEAKAAGVHILMVTGDNPETGLFIARQAGIATADTRPITGSDLEKMSDEEIVTALKERTVFARVLPSQKLRLARLLRDQDEVIAMTGDGVNDAPALQAANIGVAVGSGTEVAKEASDLVLLDNSFSIIVAAIEEGRRIIDNLKKIVVHLLSTSFGGVFLIAGALAIALPLPVLPAQILWINIIEGGLLSFVFAFEPSASDVMKRDPRSSRVKNLISTPMKWLIFVSGTITGLAAFVIYVILSGTALPIEQIRTIMFVILTIDALLFVLSLKDFYKPIYKINFFNNNFLFAALGLSLTALLAAVFIPGLREFLELGRLTAGNWLLIAGVAVFYLIVVEVAKYILFQRKQ